VQLVDAPSPQVSSIFVSISDVSVRSQQAGWTPIFQGLLTIDLLTLKTQAMSLGFADLPAGTVDQIRLVLDPNGPQYVVLADGTQAPLTIPSGTESGIKLTGTFTVSACRTHTVTIDFDGENSVSAHATGKANHWQLRPVVRVKSEEDSQESCDDAAPDGGISEDGGISSGDGLDGGG